MRHNATRAVQPVAFLVAMCASLVSADASDLSWYTIDGGGEIWSIGGSFTLGGSIGQADAGTLAADAFTVSGGFWVSSPTPRDIPTVSQWGMIVMTLLMFTAGTLVLGRWRTVTAEVPRAA